MFWRFCAILFIGILLDWKLTHSAPADGVEKAKEKVRPYEFGFTIEEQQHRHEKRDENGIVMGEFGFITADGIYHVTVYATDENGKFKIISMKSYPYGNVEKKVMIAMMSPTTKKPVVTTAPTVIKAMKPDGSSCGGCVKPKKMQPLPADVKDKQPVDDEKAVFNPLSKTLDDGPKKPISDKSDKPFSPTKKGTIGTQKTSSKTPATKPLIPPKVSTSPAKKPNGFENEVPEIFRRLGENDQEQFPPKPAAKTPTAKTQSKSIQAPDAPSTKTTGKPTSSTNSSGKQSSTSNGGGGGGGGGGSGNSPGGSGGPLYRFNYVLDYNSHREEGRTDGSKEGNYKTLSEDGIRRIIDYIANENGYQPHVKVERLPPNELPNGDNKLKEYEFVWFN